MCVYIHIHMYTKGKAQPNAEPQKEAKHIKAKTSQSPGAPEDLGRHVAVRPRLARELVDLVGGVRHLAVAVHGDERLGEAEVGDLDDARVLIELLRVGVLLPSFCVVLVRKV